MEGKQFGLNRLGVKAQGLVLAVHPHQYDLPTCTLAGHADKGLGHACRQGKSCVRSCCTKSPPSFFLVCHLLPPNPFGKQL